jgi:hypothetical protein
MKPFFLPSVFVILTSAWALADPEKPVPLIPIIISVDPGDINRVLLNQRSVDLSEAKTWLEGASARFGRKDPIIIQIGKIEDFLLMSKVARDALDFYDDIFFRIATFDPTDPFLYLRFDTNYFRDSDISPCIKHTQ